MRIDAAASSMSTIVARIGGCCHDCERYLRALLAPEAIRLNRLEQADRFRFAHVAATFLRLVRGNHLIHAVSGAGAVSDDADISAQVAFAGRAISDSLRLR